MSRKQVTVNESSAAAASARAAKPKAPRVKSAKHARAAAPELAAVSEIETLPLAPLDPAPVASIEAVPAVKHVETPISLSASAPVTSSSVNVDPSEEIARIAYGYWQARGCVGGDPLEDWVRAESEYRSRLG
jgi:hypothetical protein